MIHSSVRRAVIVILLFAPVTILIAQFSNKEPIAWFKADTLMTYEKVSDSERVVRWMNILDTSIYLETLSFPSSISLVRDSFKEKSFVRFELGAMRLSESVSAQLIVLILKGGDEIFFDQAIDLVSNGGDSLLRTVEDSNDLSYSEDHFVIVDGQGSKLAGQINVAPISFLDSHVI